MVMYRNGIIIQSIKNNGYKGVDGSGFSADSAENWYLNNYQDCADFEEYYDEYINRTYYNTDEKSFVAVCNDWNYIEKYITESKKRGIPFRIILCETEIPEPIMEIPEQYQLQLLGYDYAYAAGDNYSAVYNEIPFIFADFNLNSNGLFTTEEEIREYIRQRNAFEKEHPKYTLEAGDFIIFKLYEVIMPNDW